MIYKKLDLDMQYFYYLEQQLKNKRTTIIDPDEELLNKEIPIRVLKRFSNYFRRMNLLFLMYESNIYIADKLYIDKHYESASNWYIKVLKEVAYLKFYNKTPHIYYRLGACALKMHLYNDTLIYLKKAKIFSSGQNDHFIYSKTLYHLANTYMILKDFDNSWMYIKEMLMKYKDYQTSYNYVAGLILKARILYTTGFVNKSFSICDLMLEHINEYDFVTQEHAYIEIAQLYYNINDKNAIFYTEIALRYCMQAKDYDFILHLSNMLDTMYRYYNTYTCCYDNINSLIKYMADKNNRKYCYLSYIDILFMKMKRLHYKYLTASHSYENV